MESADFSAVSWICPRVSRLWRRGDTHCYSSNELAMHGAAGADFEHSKRHYRRLDTSGVGVEWSGLCRHSPRIPHENIESDVNRRRVEATKVHPLFAVIEHELAATVRSPRVEEGQCLHTQGERGWRVGDDLTARC